MSDYASLKECFNKYLRDHPLADYATTPTSLRVVALILNNDVKYGYISNFARWVGVSSRTASKWLSGEKAPDSSHYNRLHSLEAIATIMQSGRPLDEMRAVVTDHTDHLFRSPNPY